MFQNTLSNYSTLNTNLVGAKNNLNPNWVSGFADTEGGVLNLQFVNNLILLDEMYLHPLV